MKKEGGALIGTISVNTKGVGFFDIETEGKSRSQVRADSIEIQPEHLGRAFHGDIVEISFLGQKIKNREQGKVEKIVKRFRDEFVGTVEIQDGKTFVMPDDKRMYVDIFLSPDVPVTKIGRAHV